MGNLKEKEKANSITRGTKKLITEIIEKNGDFNRVAIRDAMCDVLCDRFAGESLEYQLERMKIETIKEIDKAIDTFMFKHLEIDEIGTTVTIEQ